MCSVASGTDTEAQRHNRGLAFDAVAVKWLVKNAKGVFGTPSEWARIAVFHSLKAAYHQNVIYTNLRSGPVRSKSLLS